MCTNFDFLKKEPLFESFSASCIEAEKSLLVSYATAAILTRRALELVVKWVYAHEDNLEVPYQDQLSSLIHDWSFRKLIGTSLFPKLRYIQKLGNSAVHTSSPVEKMQANLALHNLFDFVCWIEYSYAQQMTEKRFDETLLPDSEERKKTKQELQNLYEMLSSKDRKLEEVAKENAELRQKLTARRQQNEQQRDYRVDEISEYKTRKLYIDLEIKLAGWSIGSDCREEVKVQGMPNHTGEGFVDYVLYGTDGKPLALIEAKRTSTDPRIGKQQARLYADCLEQEYNLRPVIFYTNGFDYFLWDDVRYPERRVSGIFTRDDLEWMVYQRSNRKPLQSPYINPQITDRVYQKLAIGAVCDTLDKGHRKALLVMATGTGKTRVAISILDVLMQHGWVKNALFLADRKALVKQAKKNFKLHLPQLSLCNLLDGRDNPESRMVFSTYPTMMNCIDDTKCADGSRLFTPGHFDLIIIDESHRSIYKKYQAIFEYFDGILLGLTATPRADLDRNTYEIFELENNVPTYAYELDEAINEGYLVPYHGEETSMKFLEEGIHYDELSDEEKEAFEDTFDDGVRDISSDALNRFLFNNNTIDTVLHDLLTKGIKVEGGDRLGKTIIFAANKKHADFIIQRFDLLYPRYKGGFASAVYNNIKYVDTVIDAFSVKEKLPQIAVSVDMLDTGIDVPEIVNLVFFKRVRSKVKFWQMIGRGTRLCDDLFGVGLHKEEFCIFDYCSNFKFFRENLTLKEARTALSLTERLFNVKTSIVHALQNSLFLQEEYQQYRQELVHELVSDILLIDETRFNSRMKIQYIHTYNQLDAWEALTERTVQDLQQHVAELVPITETEELAKRFDYLMYSIEFAWLKGIDALRPRRKVISTAAALTKKRNIPMVKRHEELIFDVQSEEFWQQADILAHEEVRLALRSLVKLLERETQIIYYTNFTDEVLGVAETEPVYGGNELKSYRKKVNQYLKEHDNDIVVYKLRHNETLTHTDIEHLEKVLWQELGSKDDYVREFGDEPLVRLVSRIVGLDAKAAHEAFSKFLSDETLNANQRAFVKLIVDYVIANGILEKQVLNEQPFNKFGNVIHLFNGKIETARSIIKKIDEINGRLNVG